MPKTCKVLHDALRTFYCAQCTYKRVSIQKDTLAVLVEGPAVDFSESDTKLRTSQKRQVETVLAVHHIHHDDLIKDGLKRKPVV